MGWRGNPCAGDLRPDELAALGDTLSAATREEVAGILGGEVVGVGVGGDEGGAGFVETLEVGDDAAEGVEGLVGFQVADVLADEDLGAHGEGDGVLQVGADGEDGGNGRWQMAMQMALPMAEGRWDGIADGEEAEGSWMGAGRSRGRGAGPVRGPSLRG